MEWDQVGDCYEAHLGTVDGENLTAKIVVKPALPADRTKGIGRWYPTPEDIEDGEDALGYLQNRCEEDRVNLEELKGRIKRG